jgi:spore coat polysaccharide biosynthesis protein SpsF
METAAFVQARMGSRRLPGKSMLPVWRKLPLLELVLRRVAASRSLARVVLLTSTAPDDSELARLARRCEIAVFRGSEEDVLGRYAQALAAYPADAVVRVCADNPFIDPRAIEALIRFFHRAQPCDYASNHTVRSGLPDGIGAEILSAGALGRAADEACSRSDREHVTAYVVARPERFNVAYVPAPTVSWPRARLDINSAQDYAAVRRVIEQLPEHGAPLWDQEVIMAAWRAAGLAAEIDVDGSADAG